jgi:hypothetical protein
MTCQHPNESLHPGRTDGAASVCFACQSVVRVVTLHGATEDGPEANYARALESLNRDVIGALLAAAEGGDPIDSLPNAVLQALDLVPSCLASGLAIERRAALAEVIASFVRCWLMREIDRIAPRPGDEDGERADG